MSDIQENHRSGSGEPPSGEREGGRATAMGDYPPIKGTKDVVELFTAESKRLWGIAAPIIFNIICLYAINSTTLIFVGHLGKLQLSAVGISLSVISNFAFGFLMGMGSALETLCGQAFGAGRPEMLGIYLQRSWIILVASSILLCPLYVFSTPILRFLGQEDEISRLAGRFAVSIIPQMFAQAVSFPNEKFLQAQSKVMVLAWIGLGALLVHVALLCLFIFGFRWGIAGAAASYNISFSLVSVAQVTYITRRCRKGGSWTGPSWNAFKEIWPFVRLSISSAVMICLEVWYMMMLTLLAGHLRNAETNIASISICLNVDTWEFMVFVGLHAAISVRVSNELGSGRPRATKYAVIVVVVESLTIGLLCMALILGTRNYFSIIFTNDKDLQRAVAKIAYLLGITMLLNSIHPVIAGVAIGSGWQGLMAYVNVGCYYIFGLPLGLVLGYVLHRGVPGIWGGMLCGTVAQTLILVFMVWRTDWKAEAAKASKRVESWAEQKETANSET